MPDSEYDLAEIERLIKLVEARGLTELVVEEGDLKVTIRGADFRPASQAALVAAPVASALESPVSIDETAYAEEEFEEEEPESDTISVPSPMVGVFYRTSGPDAPPYVEVGDHIEVGHIIGLIEAMKVFSEVPSEAAGTVVAIAASNGQLVRSGDPLIFLRPD